jgi:hypothetical protein
MKRKPELREGNSSRGLPAELVLARPSEVEVEPLPDPQGCLSSLYVVQEVWWFRGEFANHPDGGRPGKVFRTEAAAVVECEQLNQEFRAAHCPLELPPRGLRLESDREWYAETWEEDPQRLRILGDYVQDLGLAAPTPGENPVQDWKDWWKESRPTMEPWQWEAIWTILDREPHYRVSTIKYVV